MRNLNSKKAYIVGGGIAGMAAAAFLIRDAGVKGENIFVFDRGAEGGGSFDGRGSAETGYICSGYRMFEESIYSCTYDLFECIPSPINPKKSLLDDFFKFNEKIKVHAGARLVNAGKIIDAGRLGLNWNDRFRLTAMLYLPECFFGAREIGQYFTADFFKSNFWFEWSTTFAFQPWHGVVEMKRYLCRFVHDAPKLDMTCVLSAPYCEHDFIIDPLEKWLKVNGVNFRQNCNVTDIEFNSNGGGKTVSGILLQNEKREKISILPEDQVFITNGSMTADAGAGSMEKAPKAAVKTSDSWKLWKNLSEKFTDFGRPSLFFGSPNKSKWESFTITFHDLIFFKFIEKFSGNKAGTGGLITFKDSNWIMTIGIPRQPYFINQPRDVFVCWGYGMRPDADGNFVKKKMSECSGREILEELCYHLGLRKDAPEILDGAICIPVMMPYITSQFMPHQKTDRPVVVPAGSHNFAFIGQFVEIPGEIVFTVECSIRSAKIAVKKLLNLSGKIPPIHSGKFNLKVLFNAVKTILR